MRESVRETAGILTWWHVLCCVVGGYVRVIEGKIRNQSNAFDG